MGKKFFVVATIVLNIGANACEYFRHFILMMNQSNKIKPIKQNKSSNNVSQKFAEEQQAHQALQKKHEKEKQLNQELLREKDRVLSSSNLFDFYFTFEVLVCELN